MSGLGRESSRSAAATGDAAKASSDMDRQISASLEAIQRGDWQAAAEQALAALQADEANGYGWWLLAIARENAGDPEAGLLCYERALRLLPDHREIAGDLHRLAIDVAALERVIALLEALLNEAPNDPDLVDALARALREQGRFEEASAQLRTALGAHPEAAALWNTLGALMMERGDTAKALAFYTEALRLEPSLPDARHNLAAALLASGDARRAACEAEEAITAGPPAATAAVLRVTRAGALLASGDLERGWAAYEARLSPDYPDAIHFEVRPPLWTPEADLDGRSLLVIGEQGVGDEIMFANILPDVIEALGPDGRLTLAVERRLVPLFTRTFPEARVGHHETVKAQGRVVRTLPFLAGGERIDLWAPLASLPRRWRASVDAFPDRPAFLKADPARVAAWRARLAELGSEPKVGVLCASLQQHTSRLRWLSAIEAWTPVLATLGVRFVNLQYGDHAETLSRARAAGFTLWDPPGLDLKQDLDEVAALSSALDLVISPLNATSNLAAACGASVWLLTSPGVWPQLGTGRFPWHPAAQVFQAASLDAWAPVMAEVADALVRLRVRR